MEEKVLQKNYGRKILLLEINIDDSLFVLINIYNANNELDHLKTLTDFGEIHDSVGDIQNKNITFDGDCNVSLYSFLEAQEKVLQKNYGRKILLLEINIDDSLFVLINIYNANNELDHLKTLTDFGEIHDSVGDIQNKNITFDGDCNVSLYSFLEAQVGTSRNKF